MISMSKHKSSKEYRLEALKRKLKREQFYKKIEKDFELEEMNDRQKLDKIDFELDKRNKEGK